jgi:hypothetical protein
VNVLEPPSLSGRGWGRVRIPAVGLRGQAAHSVGTPTEQGEAARARTPWPRKSAISRPSASRGASVATSQSEPAQRPESEARAGCWKAQSSAPRANGVHLPDPAGPVAQKGRPDVRPRLSRRRSARQDPVRHGANRRSWGRWAAPQWEADKPEPGWFTDTESADRRRWPGARRTG